MTSEQQDIADAVEAKLRGHDPKQWFEPELATVPVRNRAWFIVRRDSKSLYFRTGADATHFWKTGDRSKAYDPSVR